MSTDRSKWPKYFSDDCPPSDAVQKDVELFRFCCNKSCCKEDFMSYYEIDSSYDCGTYRIEAFGLSMLDSLDYAKSVLSNSKYRRKGFISIASGSVKDGVHKQTLKDKHHFTWWVFVDSKPENFFRIVHSVD